MIIILEILYSLIIFAGVIILAYITIGFIKDLVVDWKIFKNGIKCEGECIGDGWHGREHYLEVQWVYDNVPHYGKYHAISKFCRFPYKVTVYFIENKSNLGIFSIIYDVLWIIFLLILIAITLLPF